jgi:hypothetical protein
MTPFDFGSPVGRATSEILAPIQGRVCMGNHYLLNEIECDVAADYAAGMLWFSPDLDLKPTPIPWRDRQAELSLRGREVLVLTHDGAVVSTSRKLRAKP